MAMGVLQVQHQVEIQRNRQVWARKPLLRRIYSGFYDRILKQVDVALPGRVVEVGSGMGNLKARCPGAVATDLFANPWVDAVCDAYELPFAAGTLSHLILFDVFHHLEFPRAFLREAHRTLVSGGRLLLFEPYLSLVSWAAYGLGHPEPVGWGLPISTAEVAPKHRAYYAAQGNATRWFFSRRHPVRLAGWEAVECEAFAAFSYLLSGGFSRRAWYPGGWLPRFEWIDERLTRWPRLFGARCLVVLRKASGEGWGSWALRGVSGVPRRFGRR